MMATFFTTKHWYGLAEIPHIIFPPKFLPAQNFFPPKIFSMELNSKFVCSWIKNGILDHSSLAQIWKEYPKHVHSSLLYLLTKFEICYPTRVWRRPPDYTIPDMPLLVFLKNLKGA